MSPGALLAGRYRVRHSIARGGMAEVFLADDEVLDRPVAIKVLDPLRARDDNFVIRFRREASAAAGLNHENIVRVYDWGRHDELYLIVMEHIEGSTLADLIAHRGPLDDAAVVQISSGVAAALDHAHSNGVVHRDIKPGNVLLNWQGMPKVTDFGIALASVEDKGLTDTGMVMGTATYFSPEQARGEDVGPTSDLYSLGCVMFEMATGRPPFDGGTPLRMAQHHVEDTPPSLRSLSPATGPDLERIVGRLLAKRPEDRYQTGEAVRAELARVGSPRRPGPDPSRPAVSSGGGTTTADATTADATTALPSSRPPMAPTAVSPEATRPDRSPADDRPIGPSPRSGLPLVTVALVAFAALAVATIAVAVVSQIRSPDPSNDTVDSRPGPPTTAAPPATSNSPTPLPTAEPETTSTSQPADDSSTTSEPTTSATTAPTTATTAETTASSEAPSTTPPTDGTTTSGA